MESIIYGAFVVVVGLIILTFVLYVLVNVGSWAVRTFSDIWKEIIDKGYYDIFLPVYGFIKWFWIVPHRVLKGLGIYSLLAFIYKGTVKKFSSWIDRKAREKVHAFKNQRQQEQKENYKEEHRKSHYEILGIPENSSFEEIKRAYRELSQQYHPDKVNHLGSELKEVANRKFLEINQSYQALKKLHH